MSRDAFPTRSVDRYVMAAGIVSGVLYAAVYALQRAMSPLHAGGALRSLTVLYVAATVALFACYAVVVSFASRGRFRDRRARMVTFAFPALFSLALACGRPYLSTDAFTYVAQGHQVIAGHNPYTEPVRALGGTPFGLDLDREGWPAVHDVSPYGPLWTELEAAADLAAGDILTSVLLIKLIVTAFSLGCAALIWVILGCVRPRCQVLGTILYLWNPVVVMEFAGEGHNDALVVFLLLLSLYFLVRHKFDQSVVVGGVGALIKIVALVFVPLELVYAWRTHQRRTRMLGALALGGFAAAAIAVAVYTPVWAGRATFDGLRDHARPNLMSASTPSVLYWYLMRSYSEDTSARLVLLLMTTGFLAYTAVASLKVCNAATLLRACGQVAIMYLVLAPGYWPWYAAMPIALLALAPTEGAIWSILVVSFASRLAAPIDVLRVNGVMDWDQEMLVTTIIGVWSPAGIIAALAARRAWAAWNAKGSTISMWRTARPSYE